MSSLARLGLQSCRRSLLQAMTKRPGARLESTVNKMKPEVEYTPPKKTWISYGFSRYSEEIDRHAMHMTFFCSVTLCVVGGAYLMMYGPDNSYRDWSQREAYLVLRRREEQGLEPISRDFIDPARIKLPTDEELGDTEIII